MNIKALIFDFDLTLADSSQGIFQCINYALENMGHQKCEFDTIKKTIGLALPETFKELTGISEKEKGKQFTTIFVKKADEVMNENTFVFPEVYRLIPKWKELGLRLAIVSTKYRYRIEGVLEREKLLSNFDYIVGGEDVKVHKPDPEGLLLAIEKLGLEKEQVVYLGDSITDAKTAQRAKVSFIGVLTGTTTIDDFKAYSTKAIIKNLEGLIPVLDKNKRAI